MKPAADLALDPPGVSPVAKKWKNFTLRASRRGGDRESFRENLSKKNYFANFSDAQNAPGRRQLRVVKI